MADEVLPAIRSIIARELVNKYGLTQIEVSKKLKVTQPAISHYLKGIRGEKVKLIVSDREIMKIIKRLSKEFFEGKVKEKEFSDKFCLICKKLKKRLKSE